MSTAATSTGLTLHSPSALTTERRRAMMSYIAPPTATAAAPSEVTVTLVSVSDLVRYFRKRWKLGALIGLPLAALAFAALGLGTKVYEAEARLLLRIQDTNVFNFTEMSHSGSSELSAPMLVNNHRAELQARRYLEYLYTKVPDDERAAFIDPVLHPAKGVADYLNFPSPPSPVPDTREIFIRKLALSTRVEPLKDSHLIRVQVRDSDPVRAAKMANHYVQEYIGYVAQQELNVTKAASEFLEKKGEELRKRLNDSEHTLSTYRQSESLVDNSDVRDFTGDKMRLLTQALGAAEVKLTTTRQNLEMIKQAKNAGRDLSQVKLVGDNSDVSAARKLLEAAQTELADLRVMLGAKHPRMQEKMQKVATLQTQLQQSQESALSIIAMEEANSLREVDDLKQQLDKSRAELLAQGGKNVQQNLLRDQVAIDRELYQKITLRMNQTELTGDFRDSGALRVADNAVAPLKPVSPNKPVALLASMMIFGLMFIGLPVGWGLAEDHLVPVLRESAVDRKIELQVDGVNSGALTIGDPNLSVLCNVPLIEAATPPDLLAALLKDTAGTGAMFCQLCHKLESGKPVAGGTRIVVVLSAERAEGKTMLATALAGSLCMSGKKVFLMDCNSEAPAVHQWLYQAQQHSSSANYLEALRYGGSNLYVLPAHDLPSHDASELVSGYTAWIGRAQDQVDWIVIDGPSVLRSYADALPLIALASDVVFVHDQKRTSAAKLNAALNLMRPRMDEDKLRGVVMNRE